jgi:hypothetical protein
MANVKIFGPTLAAKMWAYADGAEHDVHGDILSIETDKGLGSPAGTFVVTLDARRDNYGRMWHQRIRPQDYVEIYMSRGPKPQRPKIVMRGFVVNCFSDIEVDRSGHVRRVARINGLDFGKVMLRKSITYTPEANPIYYQAPEFSVGNRLGFMNLDGFTGALPPAEFTGRFVQALNRDPALGASHPSRQVPNLKNFCDVPDSHKLFFINISPVTGSVQQIVDQFVGKPFNEQFIRDEDDYPTFYWRQAPMRNKHGDTVNGSRAEVVGVGLEEVLHDGTGTSDNEGFCEFFTFGPFLPPEAWISAGALEGGVARPSGLIGGGNTFGQNPIFRQDIFNRYGFQALRVNYPIMPFFVDTPAEAQNLEKPGTDMLSEVVRLTAWLNQVYAPNPALESGTISLRGNANVRIGNYLRINEQRREFYVEGVRHSFAIWPEPEFTTEAQVTRGLWFDHNPYGELAWL